MVASLCQVHLAMLILIAATICLERFILYLSRMIVNIFASCLPLESNIIIITKTGMKLLFALFGIFTVLTANSQINNIKVSTGYSYCYTGNFYEQYAENKEASYREVMENKNSGINGWGGGITEVHGITGGVSLDYTLDHRFLIQTGLLYRISGIEYQIVNMSSINNDVVAFTDRSIFIRYLTVPLLLKARYKIGMFNIGLLAGPYASIPIVAKRKYIVKRWDVSTPATEEILRNSEIYSTYKEQKLDVATDYGMFTGVELQFKLTKRHYISLDGNIMFDLADVHKYSLKYINRTTNYKNSILFGGVGWMYVFGKDN